MTHPPSAAEALSAAHGRCGARLDCPCWVAGAREEAEMYRTRVATRELTDYIRVLGGIDPAMTMTEIADAVFRVFGSAALDRERAAALPTLEMDEVRMALRAVLRDFDREPTEEYLAQAEAIFRAAIAQEGSPVGLDELRVLSDASAAGPWQWLDGGGEEGDELQDGHGEMIATGFRENIVFDGKPINRDGSFAAAAVNYVRAALGVPDGD